MLYQFDSSRDYDPSAYLYAETNDLAAPFRELPDRAPVTPGTRVLQAFGLGRPSTPSRRHQPGERDLDHLRRQLRHQSRQDRAVRAIRPALDGPRQPARRQSITAFSCRPKARATEALALFSFESLAAYEQYRTRFGVDPEFVAADRIRDESGCVLSYERTFMRPLLPGDVALT